jgi:TRAP-type uncharacterized transport system fused permease subunit
VSLKVLCIIKSPAGFGKGGNHGRRDGGLRVRRERIMARMRQRLILATAGAAVLFHLYAAGVSPFTALVQRPVHLALMAILGFLGLGVVRAEAAGADAEGRRRVLRRAGEVLGWGLAGVMVASALYLGTNHESLVRLSATPTVWSLLLGAGTLVAVIELTRRSTGWGSWP